MAWLEARTQLATILAAVAITSPIVQVVKRVYSTPPGSVQDLPCFIIFPPAVEVSRAVSLRIKTYTVCCTLLILDQDIDQAAALVDAYREAVVDLIDSNISLGGRVTQISSQRVEELSGFHYGGRDYTGFNMFLTIEVKEAKSFAGG